MIRRNTSDEAGARSDGLMIVSVIFIAAFTFIAFTTTLFTLALMLETVFPN